MKIITIILVLIVINISGLFSQRSEWYEPQPKGMYFVPMGSYIDKTGEKDRTVSLPAYWMSNEITNKEYREFTDYAAKNPDEILSWVEFVNENNPAAISSQKKVSYAEIINDITVDTLALSKEYSEGSDFYKKYQSYFTGKEFEDYPVVGVSYYGAFYYCLWKTTTENKKLKEKNKDLVQDYRIPMYEEMLYVASLCGPEVINQEDQIRKVKYYNDCKKIGCFNIKGNVSEWICTPESPDEKIVFGCSFLKDKNEVKSSKISASTKSGTVGFRIVRSYGKPRH